MTLIPTVWCVIAVSVMADFRAGAGKTQDEPRIYCHTGKHANAKKNDVAYHRDTSKSQNEVTSTGQIRDSLSIKIIKIVMNHNNF